MANNELYPYLPMFTEENTLSEETNKDDLTITSCQELLDYEVQPEFFIINPLIPKEAITSITADSGKGKSLFALILAYHIASGLTLFDKFEVDQGKVLIIDQEMNKNTIVTRFKRLIDKNIPIDYIIDQKFMITDNTDFARLLVSIVRNEYKIIIFDTFTEIHDKEENDSGAMKAVNKQILKLIRRTNVSCNLSSPSPKVAKGRAAQSI